MHIQLSSATYEHLKGSHFIFERRGIITIKVGHSSETFPFLLRSVFPVGMCTYYHDKHISGVVVQVRNLLHLDERTLLSL